MGDDVDRAGVSAGDRALEIQLEIEFVSDQIRGLNQIRQLRAQELHNWSAGSDGERQIAKVLANIPNSDWRILFDRRWPGTSRANIDIMVIGPGGVFVIDVKKWREPRIEDGHLWWGQSPADDAVDKLLGQTAAVEAILVDDGLAPSEVVPVLVFVGQRLLRTELGRVRILGDLGLAPALARTGVRLSPQQVDRIVTVLDRECPPHAAQALPRRPAAPREATAEPFVLLDEAAIIEGMLEAAAREPIESWMTWLHPLQGSLVRQSWNGPARIRGAAGTGKTVVALHRAKYLACQGKRVLFTSFVATLPKVQAQLFARLAPDLPPDRVEFVNIHRWALRFLSSRGVELDIDNDGVSTCFSRAWMQSGRDTVLGALNPDMTYWRDEIDVVIKGRGLTSLTEYSSLNRVGRRTPLQSVHRDAVWRLFGAYERRRIDRGLHDWADVLQLALEEVRRQPPKPAYDAVIVDEVQDLTSVGVQLLHALVGDAPDGLLLVGDGQQAVYPGGFALTEAGVSVVGRSRILERNYRNAGEILRAALAVVAADTYDDLEVERVFGARVVDVERPGGNVVTVLATDRFSQEASLLAHLHDMHELEGARLGDMAVLCRTNAEVASWARVLQRDGLATQELKTYAGHASEAVKLGTYQRAKGLEFAYVFVPDYDRTPTSQRRSESDDTYRERAELERRQLFVAMTRARDGLWLGGTAGGIPNGSS